MKNPEIQRGIFYLEGQPKFFLSADYPYYRDQREKWFDQLKRLKNANVDVVTFYVPWRHHLVSGFSEGKVDFSGLTQSNRDVLFFMQLCTKLDLYMVIKPGPFIHAETTYGGLPEFVNPDINPHTEAMLDNLYQKRMWHNPLPAPLQSHFMQLVESWFQKVNQHLIQPNAYPKGNVIALQILNEGMYSDGQRSPLEYDYSASGIKAFQAFLELKYGTCEAYNSQHAVPVRSFREVSPVSKWACPSKDSELKHYLDWAEFQSWYMGQLYREYGHFLKQNELPIILNLNPAAEDLQGLDFWLTRVQPERWEGVHYGYTNWIGVVSHDDSAFNRYLALIKRQRGINLEENWGFSKLYDYRYAYPVIPFFQTVLAVAAGATGFNIYTGVGTDNWDDHLDSRHERPYPDSSPITHTGEVTQKFKVLKLLNTYIQYFQQELLESESVVAATYGLYLPYAYCAAWAHDIGEWRALGQRPPRCGYKGLDAFQKHLRHQSFDFDVLNLETADLETLLEKPLLVLVGGYFMKADVQQKLVDYIKRGGTLWMLGEVPEKGEDFERCQLLREQVYDHMVVGEKKSCRVDHIDELLESVDLLKPVSGEVLCTVDGIAIAYKRSVGTGQAVFVSVNLLDKNSQQHSMAFRYILNKLVRNYPIMTQGEETQAWCYQNVEKNLQHVFVLSLSRDTKVHNVMIKDAYGHWAYLSVKLPAKSAAIVRTKNGKISDYLIKGINEFEESHVSIDLSLGNQHISHAEICDVLVINSCAKPFKRILKPEEKNNHPKSSYEGRVYVPEAEMA